MPQLIFCRRRPRRRRRLVWTPDPSGQKGLGSRLVAALVVVTPVVVDSTECWPKTSISESRMVQGITIRLAGMKALAVTKQQ